MISRILTTLTLTTLVSVASAQSPRYVAEQLIDSTGDGAGNVLGFPMDLAMNSSGSIFVGSQDGDCAFEIAPDGTITTIIDAAGDGLGNTLDLAVGIAVGPFGNVFVTGAGSNNVFRIAPDGTITEIIDGSGDGNGNLLDGPNDVAVDSVGNAYVVGQFSDNLFRIEPNGNITELVDSTGDGLPPATSGSQRFDFPVSVAIDGNDNIHVLAYQSKNVFRIDPAGNITEILNRDGVGGSVNFNPGIRAGLAVDLAGNVFAGSLRGVFKVTANGSVSLLIPANVPGAILGPLEKAIDLDANGDLYVCDTTHVYRFAADGTFLSEVIGPDGDGAGNAFQSCFAVLVDGLGNVFAASTRFGPDPDADAVFKAAIPYEGSSADLALRTGINAAPSVYPIKQAAAADALTIHFESPDATFDGGIALLLLDPFPTSGAAASVPGFPELHVDLGSAIVVDSSNSIFGANFLPPRWTRLPVLRAGWARGVERHDPGSRAASQPGQPALHDHRRPRDPVPVAGPAIALTSLAIVERSAARSAGGFGCQDFASESCAVRSAR